MSLVPAGYCSVLPTPVDSISTPHTKSESQGVPTFQSACSQSLVSPVRFGPSFPPCLQLNWRPLCKTSVVPSAGMASTSLLSSKACLAPVHLSSSVTLHCVSPRHQCSVPLKSHYQVLVTPFWDLVCREPPAQGSPPPACSALGLTMVT